MCGIAGIFSLSRRPIRPFDVIQMCEAQVHRGPDDVGYVLLDPVNRSKKPRWYELSPQDRIPKLPELSAEEFALTPAPTNKRSYRLAFGHRRLAILDLSMAGHQPMSNDTRTLWITYNGEIYNYRELREDLMKKGYRFVSTTDTEVILYLYQEFGPACVNQLNGMFAFALWDDRQECLFLARDRYGIKPLYYAEFNGQLVFASEVKALLALYGFPRAVHVPALRDYFTFQNTFGEATLFKTVSLLEPGYHMIVKEGRIHHQQYWDIDVDQTRDIDEETAREQLAHRLEGAITRQLVSDVPVGAYLSGGMDSGSITALASRTVPRMMTFTGGFDLTNVSGFEAGFDERKDAEVMSALFKTEHYQMVFHAGDLEWALPRVIWAIEDLRVGMCYPYYYTARLASRFVKVVLAGTGGDEVFGGYPWRYKHVQGVTSLHQFMMNYYQYWNRLVPSKRHREFFSDHVMKESQGHDPFDSFRAIAERPGTFGEPIRRALFFEAKTFLHGLLVVEDKLSMAHSLESRVPLLDNSIVDFVLGLPTTFLINRGWVNNPDHDENVSGKFIFRRAMEGILPERILLKRKQGFSPPEGSWYQGPLVNFVKSILLDSRTLSREFFQEQFIRRILEEHLQGKVNHRLLIWSLLSFEVWNRVFMDEEPTPHIEY